MKQITKNETLFLIGSSIAVFWLAYLIHALLWR